ERGALGIRPPRSGVQGFTPGGLQTLQGEAGPVWLGEGGMAPAPVLQREPGPVGPEGSGAAFPARPFTGERGAPCIRRPCPVVLAGNPGGHRILRRCCRPPHPRAGDRGTLGSRSPCPDARAGNPGGQQTSQGEAGPVWPEGDG
ncbi:unnamed protein product, partial [Prorocentrum cordatum]